MNARLRSRSRGSRRTCAARSSREAGANVPSQEPCDPLVMLGPHRPHFSRPAVESVDVIAIVGLDQVDRLVDIILGSRSTADVDFPGCRVRRDRDRIVVGPPRMRRVTEPLSFEYELGVPGDVEVREAGMAISAERLAPGMLPEVLTTDGWSVYVTADRLTVPLIVRNWRRGDWLKPMGLGG